MNVRFEFALGEITTLAPLIVTGILPKPEIDKEGITGKERWKAQGLEGKAYVLISEELATNLLHRLTRFRSRIIKNARSPLSTLLWWLGLWYGAGDRGCCLRD